MKKLGKLLRNLLIICGVLFIIALLLPDEEEMPADQEQTSVETASTIGIQTGTETASGAETLAGAEHAAGAAENPFPEDMVKEKQTEIKGDGKDQATVFVYMNGSDLESEDGEATEDLCEMLAANISSQVNVLVETIGTKSWSKRLGIASAIRWKPGTWCLWMTASDSWIVHRLTRLLILFPGAQKIIRQTVIS